MPDFSWGPHMLFMSTVLVSNNCLLGTAENHLEKESQLSNCLYQAGLWALCEKLSGGLGSLRKLVE